MVLFAAIMVKFFSDRRQFVESLARRAEPETAAAIPADRDDRIKADAVRVERIMPDKLSLSGVRIKQGEAKQCTQPELSIGAFTNCHDAALPVQLPRLGGQSKSLKCRFAIESVEAIKRCRRAHPDISFTVFVQGGNNSVVKVMVKKAGGVIVWQGIQAIHGADPQRALIVNKKDSYMVIAQTIWIGGIVPVADESAIAVRQEPVETLTGADPESAGLIFGDRVNVIVADTLRGCRIVQIADKCFGLAIESIQSLGADPERSIAIFKESRDDRPRDRRGVKRIMPKNCKLITVITIQPVAGAEPHEAFMVLQNSVDEIL